MIKKLTAVLLIISVVLMFSSCKSESTNEESTTELPVAQSVNYGEATTTIQLNGTTAVITGSGAIFDDGDIIISQSGTYGFSGSLSDGRIVVNAEKQDVTLLLCGASVTCSDSSAIYVYKSDSTTVIAEENTENTLTDASTYSYNDSYSSEADEEPNACLYSKSDLIIGGSGTLNVIGNSNNGITSKDTLQICDATISVKSANHGINGKDSNVISNAVINVESGGDGVRSTNDTDTTLGYISISDTDLTVTSGEDGIQAQTALSINGGNYTIISGSGSSQKASDTVSTKGIKAETTLTLAGGTFTIDSSDDSVHAGSDVTVSGGTYTISSGDDGIHSDTTLNISGGNITVVKSYEGFEGTNINISGGTSSVASSDDGINAAGGVDSSGFGGMDKGGFGGSSSNSSITISGGYTVVDASGDGIDSNGSVSMTDGTVIVYGPTDNGNGALDYDSDFKITGGTLIVEGSSGMAQSPSEATICSLSTTFSQTLQAGTYISISNGTTSFVFKTKKAMSNIVFASPKLTKGGTYTISYGGTYSGGSEKDGVMTGGTYSGGTELTSITLSDYLSSYGSVGIGGSMGGGMMQGGGMGGRPNASF